MLKYSLKRLIRSLLTLVILITVIFALLRLMPEEGYFSNYEKMSPQQIENGLRELGLKDPLYVQVGRFFKQLLQGDLGVSHRYRINYPITQIIEPKMAVSMKFGLICILVSLPLGMGLGALMARSKGRLADKLGNAYIVFIQAVPNAVYFIAIQLYGSSWFGLPLLYDEAKASSMIPQFRGANGKLDSRLHPLDHLGFHLCRIALFHSRHGWSACRRYQEAG